mmetsp:Transcript_27378/g.76480  ORF Transcript_27378/g.76480 Transcript_27378/m.76480 type:complete len:476 (+) Transcript_27378:86-1513(+)
MESDKNVAALAAVQKQVEELRKDPAPGLLEISDAYVPPLGVREEDGHLVVRKCAGGYVMPGMEHVVQVSEDVADTVAVDFVLRGPEGTTYARDYPMWALLRHGVPYLVGFRAVLVNAVVDNGVVAHPMFYDRVEEEGSGRALRVVCTEARRLLRGAYHKCEKCVTNYEQFAGLEAFRKAVRVEYLEHHALRPELFAYGATGWPRTAFAPDFLAFADSARGAEDAENLVREEADGVYSFPLFTRDFCEYLVKEVEAFEATGLLVAPPNSMNKAGLKLNEIGLADTFSRLQRDYLQALAGVLFPVEGASLETHHTFIVQYAEDEDQGLDMHTDDSEVTFNVCLGKDFTGARLNFCGGFGRPDHRQHSKSYAHEIGRCVVHLGTRRHGAADILSGERFNLIMWNYSQVYRSSVLPSKRTYSRETSPPAPVCLSYTHDRDFDSYLTYPEGKAVYKEKAWCPPPGFAHDDARPTAACSHD